MAEALRFTSVLSYLKYWKNFLFTLVAPKEEYLSSTFLTFSGYPRIEAIALQLISVLR